MKAHGIWAVFIAAFLILCVVVVTDATAEYGATPDRMKQEATWQPPPIPDCDQELWIRVKDRCSGD